MTRDTEIGPRTRIRGAEFRDFYLNHWPDQFWIDDIAIEFEDENGNYILPDEGDYELDGFGSAVFNEFGEDGTWRGRTLKPGQMIPVWEVYAEVMGARDTEMLVAFKIDPEKAGALVAAAEALGARHI